MNDSEQQRKVQSCAARIVTGFFFDIIVNKKKNVHYPKKKNLRPSEKVNTKSSVMNWKRLNTLVHYIKTTLKPCALRHQIIYN